MILFHWFSGCARDRYPIISNYLVYAAYKVALLVPHCNRIGRKAGEWKDRFITFMPQWMRHFHVSPCRFWARNFLAWPRFRDAQPNETHRSIAKWERSDRLDLLLIRFDYIVKKKTRVLRLNHAFASRSDFHKFVYTFRFHWLVTQNVDGLHTKWAILVSPCDLRLEKALNILFIFHADKKVHRKIMTNTVIMTTLWFENRERSNRHFRRAGSSQQTELHGCGHRVKCMECDYTMSRWRNLWEERAVACFSMFLCVLQNMD